MTSALTPSLLSWLRAFDAAARCASFTRAAEELNLSQGAVSQQVKHLEAALGVALFVRRARSLELTPEGQKLAPVLESAFGSIRSVVSELTSPGGRTPVTLSCSPTFAWRWLGPRLGGSPPGLAHIDLRVFGEFHALDRQRMAGEGLEVAIRYDALSYPDLSIVSFLDEHLIAIASPAYVAQNPSMVRATRLNGRSLLYDTRAWQGAAEGQEWEEFAVGSELTIVEPHLGTRFNLSQLAIDAALAGKGVAVGRLALVLSELEEGQLVPLWPIAVRSSASYKVLSRPGRPTRIAAIERWLRDEAARFVMRRETLLATLGVRCVG